MIDRSYVRLPVESPSNGFTTRMSDCMQTGKPSRYITNTKVKSTFHPSGADKSSTGPDLPACMAGVKAGHIHLCRVAANTV